MKEERGRVLFELKFKKCPQEPQAALRLCAYVNSLALVLGTNGLALFRRHMRN